MSLPTAAAPPTPHSRNANLTEAKIEQLELPGLDALKLHPQRLRMSIDALITPPNSEEVKLRNNFDQVDPSSTGQETDLLFPTPPTKSAQLHLFGHSSKRSASGEIKSSIPNKTHEIYPGQEDAIREWTERDRPDWEYLKERGTKRQRGVHTWDQLIEYQREGGIHMTRPLQSEYELVASFLNGMKESDPAAWTNLVHTAQAAASPIKKRKVLQDKTPARRNLVEIAPSSRKRSTTPSVYGDLATGRRRASRNNPKISSAETKSARAPSSKPPKDPDWWNYPDYAPDFDQFAPSNAMALAGNAHKFDNKDNKKGPRDLSSDPNKEHLREPELLVASWLHLDCHRYLTSKRQIFQGYVEHLQRKLTVSQRVKEGLEEPGHTKLTNWNKTEAQKLLGIDVSKGSYIWSFYKDLGWFEDNAHHLYEQHL